MPAAAEPMDGAPDEVTGGSGPPASEQPAGQAGSRASTRGRRVLVRALIWVTTVLAVVGIFAVWANRQMLDPDNWANTSTQLLQNGTVRSTLSDYLVDQLYANVNVARVIAAPLPRKLQPLSGPISGALRNVLVDGANRVLATPLVQAAWRVANVIAARTLVAIVDGRRGAVSFNGGRVTLDLVAVVRSLAGQLGLPDVSSKLPPSVAQLTVLRSNQIKTVQVGGRVLRALALGLTILVPLLYALAILLAQDRRREALLSVGFAILLAGLLVFLARKVAISAVTSSLVKTDSVKPAARVVLDIATSMLSEIAGGIVVIGVCLAGAAWFAGPSRWATRGRRGIAPAMRQHAPWAFGAVAIILVLVFIWAPLPATRRPAGIIVFTVLAFLGTELLRRQIERDSLPSSSPGESSRAR